MKNTQPLTPVALYARVSSDRQDVDPVGPRPNCGPAGPRQEERLCGGTGIHR